MSNPKLSYYDIVKACDDFQDDDLDGIYQLFLPHDEQPHGYMLPEIVAKMPWTDEFKVSHQDRTVKVQDSSKGADPSSACNAAFAKVVDEAIEKDIFETLHGKHSEMFKIMGARYPVQVERFASHLFGITARGAHLTVYTMRDNAMKIWVPRRAASMFTYPNKLDTTVAGGVPAHQSPFENVVQEADEEASLPAELIHRDVRAAGVLTYIGRSKQGLVVPDSVYTFDLEVGADITPIPRDGEVKEFYLMSVDEIKEAMANDEFKPNSALVMLDFFIRHGIVTSENEKDYVDIVSRMHRRLPFPTGV